MRRNIAMLFACIPLSLACATCSVAEPAPTVGFYKLDDLRISGATSVISAKSGFSGLDLLVTVDTAGNVIAAKPIDNFQNLDPAPALALVKSWKFRPPTFEGKPVNATGRVNIDYIMQATPPDPKAAFPASAAPDETVIALDRGACFGSCPDYHVSVRDDGLVDFSTREDHFKGQAAEVHLQFNGHNVLLPGHHTARIDPAAVAALLEKFRKAQFFGLKSEYFYGATDNSTQVLSLKLGKSRKVVTDYIGTMAGMPQEVRDLEAAVDDVAGTERWVSGNAETLVELDTTGFDYHSKDAGLLAAAAAEKLRGYRPAPGTEQFILAMVKRGVVLNMPIEKQTLGAILLQAAAENGSDPLFEALVAHGVMDTVTKSALNGAFQSVSCSPALARALVKAGADPRRVGENGTALTALRSSYSTCDATPEKKLEMASELIKLGVPLEARDNLGWTALMGCESPELAQLLLDHGADPKARAKDGTTPVLATDDDRVALILLRAGADPLARNGNGSVREQAIKGHMPATLAWLDAHGIR